MPTRRHSAALAALLALSCGSVYAQQPAPASAPAPTAPAASAPAPAAASGDAWSGVINVMGQELGFILKLFPAESPVRARMSIPMQGLPEVALSDVARDGDQWRFTLALPGMTPAQQAKFSVKLNADAQTASGEMKQSGQTFPVSMKRLAPGETGEAKRPQHPKPPFPYRQREVQYAHADGAKFTGTLTLPDEAKFGPGPYPAALLITGSGTQDRDESLMGHKPFLVIADDLTKRGVAILRVDDRGWNGNADPANGQGTTLLFAEDAEAGIAFLKSQPEADPKHLGLIGHSEGGLIAPIVAARNRDVSFIVLLAGTGVTGKEILKEQMVAMMQAEGAPAKALEEISTLQTQALDAVIAGDQEKALALTTALTRAQLRTGDKEPEEATLKAAAEMGLKQINSPWMRTFLTLDPQAHLTKVTCPVLILNGSKDMQVLARQNVPPMVAALMQAGNPDVTAIVLPSLNHLFQPCTTGGGSEYAKIETTFAPEALDLMGSWITEKTRK